MIVLHFSFLTVCNEAGGYSCEVDNLILLGKIILLIGRESYISGEFILG